MVQRGTIFTILYLFSLITIFSSITFFLNEKLREYLIISVTSIIFSIYIFEIYLIFNSKFDKKQKIKLLEMAQINYEKKLVKNMINELNMKFIVN